MKATIEIEIPEGGACSGTVHEYPHGIIDEWKCRVLDDGADCEYAPACQHPDAPSENLGCKDSYPLRSAWCIERYGKKEDAK